MRGANQYKWVERLVFSFFLKVPATFTKQLIIQRLLNTILDSNETDYSGGHCERATPDPIPNSEVKPLSADGTA